MSVYFNLANGTRVEVVMPREQGLRLSGTCFRGRRCRQAGNFFAWDNFRDFLTDPEVRRLLIAEFERLVALAQVNKRHRVELEFARDIGWDSVLSRDSLEPGDMEVCELREINARTKAMFLPSGHIDAPRTNIVTMALRMFHDSHWKFVIGTMYPGHDCGELRGKNLTDERGLVFLHWSNPGE